MPPSMSLHIKATNNLHASLHSRDNSDDTVGSLSDWAIALWFLLFFLVLAIVVTVTLRWTKPQTPDTSSTVPGPLPWYRCFLPSFNVFKQRSRRGNDRLSWECSGAFPSTYTSNVAGGKTTKTTGFWAKIFNHSTSSRRQTKVLKTTHHAFSLASPSTFSPSTFSPSTLSATPRTPMTPWTPLPVTPSPTTLARGAGIYTISNKNTNRNSPQLPASVFQPTGPNFSRPGDGSSGSYTPHSITHTRVWSRGSEGGMMSGVSGASQEREVKQGIEMARFAGSGGLDGEVKRPGAAKLTWV